MASKARAFEEAMRKKREEEGNARNADLESFKRQREAGMKAKREAEEKATAAKEEKDAQMAKRDAFKARHAMFEKKGGPSEEEKIKTGIVKASQNRRFEKQMKNMMAENHGKNPLAMEMALRAKIGNSTVHVENEGEQTFEGAGTAEYVEEVEETEEGAKKQSAFRMAQELAALKVTGRDDGHVTEVEEEEGWGELVKPVGEGGEGGEDPSMVVANWKEMNDDNGHYFWNTVTNDTSYDEPPCMVVARTGIEWQKVDDDGSGNSYYWNVVTNDTSYEPPTGFKEAGGREGAIRGSGGAAVEEEEEGEAIMWTEYVNKEGKRMYQQSDKPEVTREDKPDGAVLVACEDESMWSEALGEDGSVSYTNAVSGEVRTEKPDGVIMVAEVKGGGWQVHQDGEGNEYYYNAGTGKSQYEKPEDM